MYGSAEPFPPPQRRDNGLRADKFVALADVDPRLGEHLLDLLRLAEIAAYLEPPGDPRVAVRYRVAGPIERLFVQADLRRAAREVVLAAAREAGADTDQTPTDQTPTDQKPADQNTTGATPHEGPDLLAGLDTDAEFARIMAGYDATAPARPGSDRTPGATFADTAFADGLTRSGRDAVGNADDEGSGDRSVVDRGAVDEWAGELNTVSAAELDARAADMARARAAAAEPDGHDREGDDPEDHFVPPVAPPFPVPRPQTVGAVALFLFGLLVMARGYWFGLDSTASFPLGVIAVLVAIGLLIKGLHDSPPDDVEPDDGAIV